MHTFWKMIQQLQWDDHRYYHQCRINQSLHLISALSFLVAYGLLLVDPASAGYVGWLIGMVTRQSGHIFLSRGASTRPTRPAMRTRKPSRSASICGARPF